MNCDTRQPLTVLCLLIGLVSNSHAQSVHSDVQFRYAGGKIEVQTANGMGVATGQFTTSGIFRQFDSNPGFASEVDAGLGINPGDVVVYNVLDDLINWDGAMFTPPASGTQIRIENNGTTDLDTIVSGESGPQPGSFSPSANTIDAAGSGGDFHAHVDYFLEPNTAPAPPPPPELGVFAIKLSLSTSAPEIADSDPFFVAFNFGLGQEEFDLAVAALSAMLEPTLTGDYNGNGVVDAADYVVWRNTFGSMSELAADGDGDGSIDADDYNVWRQNFGSTLAAAESQGGAAVPEPASALLQVLGVFCIVLFRQRQKGATPID